MSVWTGTLLWLDDAGVGPPAGIEWPLRRVRLLHPQLTLAWADSAYSGDLVDWSKRRLRLTLKIVNRPPGQSWFVVLARRWIVERTLCAARRSVASPAEPGGTWREVSGFLGRMAYLDPKGEGDNSMPGNPAAGPRGLGRGAGGARVIWRKLDCLNPNLQSMQVPIRRKDL
jgi:hypothetical protein